MKKADLFFTSILIPFDLLTLLGAAAAAYTIRFSSSAESFRPVTFDLPFGDYMEIVFPIVIIWILIFALSGLYTVRPPRIAIEMTRVIIACSAGIAAFLGIAFLSRDLFESRFIILAFWGLSLLFIVTERLLIRGVQRSLRKYGIGMKYVIVIGKTKTGNILHDHYDKHPTLGFEVVEHVNEFNKETKKRILQLKKQGLADIILLANPNAEQKQVRAIKTFSDIEHLSFTYSADIFPGSAVKPIIHTFAGHPVIEIPKTPLDGWGAIYKRIFDIFGSLFLIILTLPIQIITMIALFIEQPGTLFFRHNRVGQGGKPFKYFKFRSMIKDAHKFRFDPEFIEKYGNMREGTPLFKLENDPRVTKVGKFIRKYSIDEIPEFYLVLMGRMSLVGPRPHMPKEVEDYKPSQRKVLTIKPGITGMAQTSGRADISFDEEVQLDMYYIENWSPWLDIILLLKTPIIVLFGTGAY